jgi:hypothetical protein
MLSAVASCIAPAAPLMPEAYSWSTTPATGRRGLWSRVRSHARPLMFADGMGYLDNWDGIGTPDVAIAGGRGCGCAVEIITSHAVLPYIGHHYG